MPWRSCCSAWPDGELLPLVERYVSLKRRRDAADHGDQVALAARLARDDPAVAEIERSRFSVVCSTSTRTPDSPSGCCCAPCTAVGTR